MPLAARVFKYGSAMRRAIGADVERGDRAVREGVLGVHRHRALEGFLCAGDVGARPAEIGERQARDDRLGIDLDRLLEGGLGLVAIALLRSHGGEVGVGLGAVRIELDRLFDLADGAVEVFQPDQRIAEDQLRLDVGRIAIDDRLDAGLGVLEPARQHQEVGGADLRRVVQRQEIGGAHRLAERLIGVPDRLVGLGELDPRLAELAVRPQRVPVFDDRFLGLAGLEELVGVVEMLALGLFGVGARRRATARWQRPAGAGE